MRRTCLRKRPTIASPSCVRLRLDQAYCRWFLQLFHATGGGCVGYYRAVELYFPVCRHSTFAVPASPARQLPARSEFLRATAARRPTRRRLQRRIGSRRWCRSSMRIASQSHRCPLQRKFFPGSKLGGSCRSCGIPHLEVGSCSTRCCECRPRCAGPSCIYATPTPSSIRYNSGARRRVVALLFLCCCSDRSRSRPAETNATAL
mmetsp:Transcript_15321/g.38036  ORF Transcript_15321/g.38036 Transcript_15321/m.38036 type:complete len:204 (-) Transcript_15321:985-1596(-)